MPERTYWNGQRCRARRVVVVVGAVPVASWWCAPVVGQRRRAVEVETGNGRPFYLDACRIAENADCGIALADSRVRVYGNEIVNNGKAGLMTRGLAEMIRLGAAAGANRLTFAGLAGIGDVIATCGSRLSRNHRLGEELAKGRSWTEIEQTLPGVAEGAYTVDAALALADRYGVEMPIAQEVHNALFEGKSVQRCLIDLLSRESKDELQDLG